MHKSSAINRRRAQVTQHRVVFALLAGFLATNIVTITGYWYPIWHWPKMDYGMTLLPKEDATTQFLVGMVAHHGTGMCFALIYAFLIHPLLPGPNSVPALGPLRASALAGTDGHASARQLADAVR